MNITITERGIDKVKHKYTAMAARDLDYHAPFMLMEAEIAAGNAAVFATQGAIYGGWAPLSPRYSAWKLIHIGPRPIMVSSGDLLASLSGVPMGVSDIDSHSARFGTNVRYARYHQSGTRKMPRRQIVGLPPGVTAGWGRIIGSYVVDGL